MPCTDMKAIGLLSESAMRILYCSLPGTDERGKEGKGEGERGGVNAPWRGNWRRQSVLEMNTAWGYILVHFVDEPPSPATGGSRAPAATPEHVQACDLTARLRLELGGDEYAVRRLMDRRQESSYALIRMSAVLSKVWVRSAERVVPGATARDQLVTFRFT